LLRKVAGPLPKIKALTILTLSFAAAFTVILFAPFDLYLHNPTSFIVGWKLLLPPLLLYFLIAFVVLSAILLLLWRQKFKTGLALLLTGGLLVTAARFAFQMLQSLYPYFLAAIIIALALWILSLKMMNEKAIDAALLVAWGVLVSSYVQILFLNGGMAPITGDRADYGALTFGNIVNLLIWGVLTFTPLCLWLALRARKKEFQYEKPLMISMLLIFGMQAAGLVSAAVSTELPKGYDEENPRYISYGPALKLNSDENIIIFILDRLAVDYMNETLEAYPELYEQLDGFVFYENNIAESPQTFPSVTTMLTQHYYTEGLTFSEYWEEAWARHNAIDALRENGFSTNLYLDKISTYGSLEEIESRTDNLKNIYDVTVRHRGMINAIGRLSFGRLAPYFLKNFFLAPMDPSFGNDLFSSREVDPAEVQPPAVGVRGDLRFYQYIKQNEFTADSNKKVFNAIHLNCSHADFDKAVTRRGYRYDKNSGEIKRGGNYIDSTRACFEILNIYFTKMKELGVYDNSTIILAGDHGVGWAGDGAAVTTALLIKRQNAAGALIRNAEAELSNQYFGASILHAAGIGHENLGVSYFDIIGGAPPPIRSWYNYTGWWGARGNSEMIALRGIYEISGDANDYDNWKYIDFTS